MAKVHKWMIYGGSVRVVWGAVIIAQLLPFGFCENGEVQLPRVVVVAQDASQTERLAGEELCRYLQEATGQAQMQVEDTGLLAGNEPVPHLPIPAPEPVAHCW